jgi:hypothetical protein
MSIFSEKSLFFASSQPRSPDVLAWKMIARHHYEVHPTPGRAPGLSWWDALRARALRAVRQFAWLEAGSVKEALSRPAPPG